MHNCIGFFYFNNMDFNQITLFLPGAIIGLTVHEYAHAFVAYKLGDNTAKLQGRLTLNPLKHIDWLGFFLIVVAGFGWAKPVIINPENFKKKHRDEILVSLAGPFSNLLLAVLLFVLTRLLVSSSYIQTDFGVTLTNLLFVSGYINIALFVFNLIPIPPLDGSHLYSTYLHKMNPQLMGNIYKYGTLALLLIIIAESTLNINILHISEFIQIVLGFSMQLVGINV